MSTILVGLSGPSSSGKSIPFCKERGEHNWDAAEAINFSKFIKTLKKVKQDPSYVYSVESLELDEKQPAAEISQATLAHLSSLFVNAVERRRCQLKVILVDGFMMFQNQELLDLLDVKILFTASYETLKRRRESRKGYNTVAGFWVDPPNYFDDFVWPAYFENHHKFLNTGKEDDEPDIRKDGGHLNELGVAQGISLIVNEDNSSFERVIDTALHILLESATTE